MRYFRSRLKAKFETLDRRLEPPKQRRNPSNGYIHGMAVTLRAEITEDNAPAALRSTTHIYAVRPDDLRTKMLELGVHQDRVSSLRSSIYH